MPPVEKLAYPVGMSEKTSSVERQENPPSQMWEIENDIPTSDFVTSLVARNNDEIWIGTNSMILKYLTDVRAWTSYTSISDKEVVPANLFLDHDGVLWGSGLVYNGEATSKSEISLLSKYDDASNKFISVNDSSNLLKDDGASRSTSNLAEDKDGKLWLIVNDFDKKIGRRSSLYLFDPETLRAELKLIAPIERQEFQDFTFDLNGNIWIIEFGSLGAQLVEYDPVTQSVTTYTGRLDDDGIPQDGLVKESDFNNIRNLYLDQEGKLWVDDRGWLDFTDPSNPIWFNIIRSPVFLGASSRPESLYGWTRPYLTYQSSNGQYWFSSIVGMVRLNPDNADWCKFTNGQSPIAEDENQYLWIAIFGKLYKFHLD
jgi:ligand-binding sensor domain-containing protein